MPKRYIKIFKFSSYKLNASSILPLIRRIFASRFLKIARTLPKPNLSHSTTREEPLVWIFIDEGHEFLPKEGKTPATDALIQLLREGRQPGMSLVLATQQPGQIHKDVMTQSDIVLSHRVTSQPDIEALNQIMQTFQRRVLGRPSTR